MAAQVKRIWIISRNIASPYSLASASYLFFLFGWSLSPKLYSSYISEPDLMFLDLRTLVFFSLCVLSFMLGVAYVNFVSPERRFFIRRIETRISSFKFLSIPVLVALSFCIVSCMLLITEYPLVILAIISQMGSAIKESDISLHAPLGLSNTWLMGILWWAMWRSNDVSWKRGSMIVLKVILAAGLAACTLSSILKASRGELMPLFFGTSVIYVSVRAMKGKLTKRFIVTFVITLFCVLAVVFALFSVMRGNTDTFWADIIGYTVAPYNRLSALLHHRLEYPYAGRGFYLISFLQSNNMLNSIVPFRKIFGWPDFMTFWQSEFSAVGSAGLNGNLIWAGAFGYIFAEIGWLSPLVVFVYGLIYGVVWRLLKKGNTFGIILYPWFAFCIMFWFGTNYLFDNKFVVLFLDAVFLFVYERITTKAYFCDKNAGLQLIAPLHGR